MGFVVGVDVGGTFTDGVAVDDRGVIVSAKTPSTPPDYSAGVFNVLGLLAEQFSMSRAEFLQHTDHIAHGTTSSLNALVMGKVPPVGFITTRGHGDSIAIMNVEGRYLGRSSMELQNVLGHAKPAPLVAKRLIKEVTQRMDREGNVLVELDDAEVREAVRDCVAQGVSAIAVSLLWSFRNSSHEQRVRDIIREEAPDIYVALSSDVSPRIREYARHATTIMSTQIGPGLRDYLTNLESGLRSEGLVGPLLVMQSSGGAITAAEAPATAITTVGSVLTGGVVGAMQLAGQLGHRNVMATDVGGTTFLAGLIVDGEPVRAAQTIINQSPVNVPTLRVEAIGSGGGAIAWIDAGGNLRVGPLSAQAAPGPACYGAGGMEPTITDANLVLGILPSRGLLGGKRPLSIELARDAIRRRIAEPLGLSVEEAAAAIYAVQNAQTGDLLRKIAVEAGHDPRDFVVYAFGGAGPAHCAAYTFAVGASEVLVPLGPVASAFSAFGLAASKVNVIRELSDPAVAPIDPVRVAENFRRLEEEVSTVLERQGIKFVETKLYREIDMRYGMQMGEVSTPLASGPITVESLQDAVDKFEELYAQLFGAGSGFRDAGIQVLTYRVRGEGILPISPELPEIEAANGMPVEHAVIERRPICLDAHDGFVDTPAYDYTLLRAGHVVEGPAVIQVPTTTVVVPNGMRGVIDHLGNLSIKMNAA
ncbi:hydantoinase/oxoprolinase family protein [Burkholderia lata]|uniref:Hydantoinase n=1 Tax=Burkholderia lata (strain ATCC 17760 / DSM 23089 / LMG 22485 / NCIMB 9086 / R18194 / 383) TaxID=482957 RepID=A0A6P2MXE3_BURL3|nr:hydantoinase/oxoprolinase family protein [Burkholderia lata]VWB90597.1 hydantoinase [Burkholderia lata]